MFSLRKAVYDEFDGKGSASCSLAMIKVYNRAMTEEGQSIELIVKSKILLLKQTFF